MKTIWVKIERNQDGFGVYAENEVFTGMGDTLDQAIENMVEGMNLYVEVMKESGKPFPAYLDGSYKFAYAYDMQSMVSYYASIIGFSGLEKITGIHQKQLGAYAKGESNPRKEQSDRFITGLHAFGTELNTISLSCSLPSSLPITRPALQQRRRLSPRAVERASQPVPSPAALAEKPL